MTETPSGTKKALINDMTSGSVVWLITRFAIPLFVSNLLQAIYNVVDMMVVGRVIGDIGLSAVNIGGSVLSAIQFLAFGFSSAGSVQIAQLVGAGDRTKLSRLIGTLFSSLAICALSLTAFCLVFRAQILSWLNTPSEAWDLAMDYVIVCSCGLIFIYGYNAVSAILRGMGDSKHPFIFISIAATTNLLLDLLFVAVLDMQALGAALATVLAQSLSFFTAIVFLARHKDQFGFDFKPRSFLIRMDALVPLVKLGIPMAIQTASVQLSKLLIDSYINACGVVVSAVTGITGHINASCNLGTNAIATASSTMIGQNLGAKKPDRVNETIRVSYGFALVIFALFASVTFFFPELLYGLFTTDANTLSVCLEYVPCAVLIYLGQALRTPNMSLINGSGNSRLNFIVAILDGIVARIGFGLLLGNTLGMGYHGYWYGNAIAGFVPVFIGMAYHLSGNWKVRKLDL